MEDPGFLRKEVVRLRRLADAASSTLARDEIKRMATQYDELADLIETIERSRRPPCDRVSRLL